MTQPPPSGPPTPPSQRNGCLQALAIVLGIVLLLPGVCTIILVISDPRPLSAGNQQFVMNMLLIGAGGIALIWWAVRRPR